MTGTELCHTDLQLRCEIGTELCPQTYSCVVRQGLSCVHRPAVRGETETGLRHRLALRCETRTGLSHTDLHELNCATAFFPTYNQVLIYVSGV